MRGNGSIAQFPVKRNGNEGSTLRKRTYQRYLLVTLKREEGTEGRVILQRMNKNIFKNPEELMENILGVTSFLRKKSLKTEVILNEKH